MTLKRDIPLLTLKERRVIADFLDHMKEEGYSLLNLSCTAEIPLHELLSHYLGGMNSQDVLNEVKRLHALRYGERLSSGEHGE